MSPDGQERGVKGDVAKASNKNRAEFILANPPSSIFDWGSERPRDDKRQRYFARAGNLNFASAQHIVHHRAGGRTFDVRIMRALGPA